MELIPLVCPKCGAPLTEGKTTKCEWCGMEFIQSTPKGTPVIVNRPKNISYSPSPSATYSESATGSYSESISLSPSPSMPASLRRRYVVRKIAESKFKKFKER